MMIHEMELSDIYYNQIASGEKTIEGRINDEKRRKINIDDFIIFKNALDSTKTVSTIVVDKKIFKNFNDAIRYVKLKNILPGIKSYKEGVDVYHSIPGYREKAEKDGVVIFYLKRV